jgi:hypothetical protein
MPDTDAKTANQARKRRRRRKRSIRKFAIAITVVEFAGRPRQSAVRSQAFLVCAVSAPNATGAPSR